MVVGGRVHSLCHFTSGNESLVPIRQCWVDSRADPSAVANYSLIVKRIPDLSPRTSWSRVNASRHCADFIVLLCVLLRPEIFALPLRIRFLALIPYSLFPQNVFLEWYTICSVVQLDVKQRHKLQKFALKLKIWRCNEQKFPGIYATG